MVVSTLTIGSEVSILDDDDDDDDDDVERLMALQCFIGRRI